MKVTKIDSILPYLRGSKYIGRGSTALCFLMKNNKVLKLFINSYDKKVLFNHYDNIIEHFSNISTLKNDTYIVPEELLLINDKCAAYIYDYVDSKVLKRIGLNTNIQDLINAYDKLVEDTYDISDKKFKLFDIHDKNMTFNRKYNIIDLDLGDFSNITREEIFKYNILSINDTIIRSLFGIPSCYEIYFHNSDINRLYRDSIHFEYQKIIALLNNLKEYKGFDTKYGYRIKKSKLIYKVYNDYYHK